MCVSWPVLSFEGQISSKQMNHCFFFLHHPLIGLSKTWALTNYSDSPLYSPVCSLPRCKVSSSGSKTATHLSKAEGQRHMSQQLDELKNLACPELKGILGRDTRSWEIKALTLAETFSEVPQRNALECQAMKKRKKKKKSHCYLICACFWTICI